MNNVRIAFTLHNNEPYWVRYDDSHVADALRVLIAIEDAEELRRLFLAGKLAPVAPENKSMLLALWKAIGG